MVDYKLLQCSTEKDPILFFIIIGYRGIFIFADAAELNLANMFPKRNESDIQLRFIWIDNLLFCDGTAY